MNEFNDEEKELIKKLLNIGETIVKSSDSFFIDEIDFDIEQINALAKKLDDY
jgi:hypothetical protein